MNKKEAKRLEKQLSDKVQMADNINTYCWPTNFKVFNENNYFDSHTAFNNKRQRRDSFINEYQGLNEIQPLVHEQRSEQSNKKRQYKQNRKK